MENYIEQNFVKIYALYLVDVVHYYSNYDQVLAEVMQPVKGYINKSPRTIEVEEDANIELIVNTNPGETTPEYCFWIENNVIEYYHPGCGKDVNIPSTINGETVLGI